MYTKREEESLIDGCRQSRLMSNSGRMYRDRRRFGGLIWLSASVRPEQLPSEPRQRSSKSSALTPLDILSKRHPTSPSDSKASYGLNLLPIASATHSSRQLSTTDGMP